MDRSHERSPRSDFARHWSLEPAVDYLNHGSFGACPTAVLEFQSELRRQLEREPVDFLWRKLPALLTDAREVLGRFVAADPDDLAFVPNATSGINAVVRSLRFEPGDEILTTDHTYGACRKALEFAASLALLARTTLGAALGMAVGPGGACPEEMVGSMACLPLPAPAPGAPMAGKTHEEVMSACRERGMETWLFPWPCAGGMVMRISAQLYNDEGQYRRLAALLCETTCAPDEPHPIPPERP